MMEPFYPVIAGALWGFNIYWLLVDPWFERREKKREVNDG